MKKYYVFYIDEEIEVSYDYDGDLMGDEDEIVIFEGTLEECYEYIKEHEKEDFELLVKDTWGEWM